MWLRGDVRTPPFLHAARVEAGVLLRQLRGDAKLGLPHSRPMPGIGARLRCAIHGKRFLRLSDEEAAFVEFKLALSKTLQALRAAQELSQVDVARRLRSSQSRVAKMEASDPRVSVDLLVRSLFRLEAQPGDIAKALRPRRRVA